jgi:cell division protein FtsB
MSRLLALAEFGRSVVRMSFSTKLKGSKMLRITLLLFVLLQLQTTFADEPAQIKITSPDEITKLIDRIDQLENRIKELERQIAKSSGQTNVPQYQSNIAPQYTAPPNQPYTPNPNSPPTYQPVPGPPIYHNPTSRYLPPNPQNKAVPESWKPFNFNGMQYYIIPVDEAARLNRPQGNDRTK